MSDTHISESEVPMLAGPNLPSAHDIPLVLWQLRGSESDLRCIAVETSYGYALSLQLAGETILLELQRDVEHLAQKAARLEAWLLTQGWHSPPSV